MILSYGAGIHNHEFPDFPNPQNDTFLTRSSSTKNSIIRRNTVNESFGPGRPHPQRSSTQQNLRFVEPTVHFQEPSFDIRPETLGRKKEGFVENSDSSSINSIKEAKQQNSDHKITSTFHIAHPAPTLTQTQKLLQIRPKLLLQLQLVSAQTRPKPSVDVLPSTVIVPRLVNRLPRIFRGCGELGINDVIIVKSEDYETASESITGNVETSNDSLLNRELMAVVCQIPKDRGASLGAAEINLSDGSVCIATPLPCGVYEIRTTDEGGCTITAHWWMKNFPQRKNSGLSDYSDINADQKFAFSFIGPNSRRHSVIATITQKNLKIIDFHPNSPKSLGKYPPVPIYRERRNDLEDSSDLSNVERKAYQIDKKLRTLIQVTGIWVALRQGWSPYFKYDDAIAVAYSTSASLASRRERSLSLTPNTRSSQQCTPENIQSSKEISPGKNVRRASLIGRPTSKSFSQSETQGNNQRVVSAGAAFVQRAAARKAGYSPTTSLYDGHDENTRVSFRRTTIERTSSLRKDSTLPRLSFSSCRLSTSEKPVSTQGRAQSAYYPSSSPPYDFARMSEKSDSKEFIAEINLGHRHGRWKDITNFTNFFRRINITNPRSKYAS